MSLQKSLVALVLVLVPPFIGLASSPAPRALAQDGAAKPANPVTIRQALEQNLGQRAKLKLLSGQDLDGKVMEVGSDVVILGELAGMEYFGATVRVDQVAAVIIRTRSQ